MELQNYVDAGQLPGVVTLVARGDDIDVRTFGPVERDTIFRIASITKPITAAAVMLLVEDGKLALDDPVSNWLPELADPKVVRTPDSPVDDVVAARRPLTVFDLLTSRAGYGFATPFESPAVTMFGDVMGWDGREVQAPPPPDEWLAKLASIPMAAQPGAAFLYHAASDLQGVLISRLSGSLVDFLAERVFEPLGMVDTAFWVPRDKLGRFTSYYRHKMELADPPDGQWSKPPAFPSGGGGLVSTVDDWLRFGRALLDDTLLSRESVQLMMTNHLTDEQRAGGELFLQGQGWGFGGSVDVETRVAGNVLGRYGWVGGTGTSAYLAPATGQVAILLTQLAVEDPTSPPYIEEFWEFSAR
ncbi:beta-lactamase family protein [Kibdelosporangium philippinense]|uniref:Beta-lactamase family protein n=1 Tax=Kibdelosporangium philippinense TaxID=211113 RepID=A0ABS8ZQ22_9PSEU|nr:serine hydrolase domain-containing protein [Kibdelosporangium philippinense]MCE7009815.1 beta-lactamase family protein [Kibdelosporangium philippinense]